LDKAVEEYMKKVNSNKAVGEFRTTFSHTINLDTVSHKITDIWKEDKDYYAYSEVLATPQGKLLLEFDKRGIDYKLTPRMMGCYEKDSNIMKDVSIIALDIIERKK